MSHRATNGVTPPAYGTAWGVMTPDLVAEMAAFDRLPVTVRRRLDHAVFEISARATLAYYQRHGAKATVQEINDSDAAFLKAAEKERGSHNASGYERRAF